MRYMTKEEIMHFLDEWTWGTLITVSDNDPYAIELSYATDTESVYCGSMPGGRMSRSVRDDTKAIFKVCDCPRNTSVFRAVIVEGSIKKLTERQEIIRGLRVLYKKLGIPESRIEARAGQLTGTPPEKASFYRISMGNLGGVAMGC